MIYCYKKYCGHRDALGRCMIGKERKCVSSSPSTDLLATYLAARRRTIEASIAAEVLAGNTFKEAAERAALAEITALECEYGTGFRAVATESKAMMERAYCQICRNEMLTESGQVCAKCAKG